MLSGQGGEHLAQRQEPGQVVADPLTHQHLPVLVDHGDVVMALCPIDPTEDLHTDALTFPDLASDTRARGPGGSLMEALQARHPTSRDQPSATSRVTVFRKSSQLRALPVIILLAAQDRQPDTRPVQPNPAGRITVFP